MPEPSAEPASTTPASAAASHEPAEAHAKPHRARKRKPRGPITEVVFYTYPKLLFAWPLIVAGFAFWPLADWFGVNAELLGWAYLMIALVVVLTISVDLERNHAFVWLLIFIIFFLAGAWLSKLHTFTFFGNIYNYFDWLDVTYSSGFGVALSLLLSGPYLVMMLWSRLNHRWRITHNEFEHYAWGRADDSLARGAKRVRSTYPDLLELLIAGAGTLIVYSATGRSELRRIPNVPMIFLVRRKINRLLESTAVTQQPHDQMLLDEMEETEEEASEPETDDVHETDAPSSGREPL